MGKTRGARFSGQHRNYVHSPGSHTPRIEWDMMRTVGATLARLDAQRGASCSGFVYTYQLQKVCSEAVRGQLNLSRRHSRSLLMALRNGLAVHHLRWPRMEDVGRRTALEVLVLHLP